MRILRIACLVLIATAPASCGKIENAFQKPANVRIVNAVPDAKNISVHFSGKKKPITIEKVLSYREHTNYINMPAGEYQLTIETDGKRLIEKKAGFGPDGHYTILIGGLSGFSEHTNQMTITATLRWIFGGIEAEMKNGLLPQMHIMRDNLSGTKKSGKVRMFHRAPGVTPLSVKATSGNKKTVIGSKIAYSKSSEPKSLKAGNYELRVKSGAGIEPLLTRRMPFEGCKLYTLIFTGIPVDHKPLELLVLQNPLKPCLK